jgi:hypothetical protein
MKNQLRLIILVAAVFFFSCKKNNTDTTDPISGNCRMVKLSDSLGRINFYYDANNRISQIMSMSSPVDTSWENYYYENGHVVFMIRLYRGTHGDTIKYTYESGKYTECLSYGSTLKYFYNGLNQLIKIESWKDLKMDEYAEYQYDMNGNCIKCTSYTKNGTAYELNHEATLVFGTGKNFYYSIGMPPLNSMNETIPMTVSPNNFTKITSKYPPSAYSLVLLYNYSGFNDQGYPTNFSMSDSLQHIFDAGTIEYVCP